VIGTLSQGAHPGGFNGQDAYTGQLVIEAMDRPALPDTPRAWPRWRRLPTSERRTTLWFVKGRRAQS